MEGHSRAGQLKAQALSQSWRALGKLTPMIQAGGRGRGGLATVLIRMPNGAKCAQMLIPLLVLSEESEEQKFCNVVYRTLMLRQKDK